MFVIEWILSFFPTALPVGRTAFDKWAASVIRLSGCPDNRSTRFALTVMIMHGKKARVPKRFFAQQLYKAAANEVAHALGQEAKAAQKAEWDAAKAELEGDKAVAQQPQPVEAPTVPQAGADAPKETDAGGAQAAQTEVERKAS